jgi:Phosphatidylethanolamine-binding protein
VNDFGKPGYAGPCPPNGHGTHPYRFRLMALSEPSLPLISNAMLRETERELDAATRKSEVNEAAELSRRKQPAPLVVDGRAGALGEQIPAQPVFLAATLI